MAETTRKYLDTEVLNYSIKSLGTKINDTFLQQKALVPNAPGDSKASLKTLQIGADMYSIDSAPDPETFLEEISEKDIDDILFAVFGD